MSGAHLGVTCNGPTELIRGERAGSGGKRLVNHAVVAPFESPQTIGYKGAAIRKNDMDLILFLLSILVGGGSGGGGH